jgi:hypothetical protein
VHGFCAESAEDQKIKRALEKIESGIILCHCCRISTTLYLLLLSNVNNLRERMAIVTSVAGKVRRKRG